jgi:hypothetical protein
MAVGLGKAARSLRRNPTQEQPSETESQTPEKPKTVRRRTQDEIKAEAKASHARMMKLARTPVGQLKKPE